MKNFFKPEDFQHHLWDNLDGLQQKFVVTIANAKLNKLLESAVVVYSKPSLNPRKWITPISENNIPIGAELVGLLIQVEDIVNEPCKHEPIYTRDEFHGPYVENPTYSPQCKHCGVELTAMWKAKESK